MLFHAIVQDLPDTGEQYLFDMLTDRCLLCVETGSDLFPALRDAQEGDRFRILVSHLEQPDSIRIQAFNEDDLWVLIGGKGISITAGAATELREFRRICGVDEAWVRVEKLEEVA